jgi:hypothetical protein
MLKETPMNTNNVPNAENDIKLEVDFELHMYFEDAGTLRNILKRPCLNEINMNG